MKKQTALEELMAHTTEEINRLGPAEKEELRTNVLKQFGLPPLSTLRKLAREAVIFALIGDLVVAVAALSLRAGLIYGSIAGLGVWTVYRLFRFALT